MKVDLKIKKCGDGYIIDYHDLPERFDWDLAGFFDTVEECKTAIKTAVNNYNKPEEIEEIITIDI